MQCHFGPVTALVSCAEGSVFSMEYLLLEVQLPHPSALFQGLATVTQLCLQNQYEEIKLTGALLRFI